MKYNNHKIIVPKWISCHTYLFGSEDSRTYISNEKRHEYVLLEGLASDMWKLLLDNIEYTEFEAWAQKNGVADQVKGFLDELAQQELIVFLQDGETYRQEALFEPLDDDARGDTEAAFIEEMQTWIYQKKFMFSLFFELTYRCNLKCVHCYNPKDMANIELDFAQCKKAIDDAYEAGCFRITFSGGEATLHSHFLELVEYARNKHISVEIFTNGQLLSSNENLYRAVLEQYPYRIGISLYSTDSKTHERVTCVKGSFDKTMSLIYRLREDNVNVQIKNFLLNFNCFDCIKVKNMAKKISATSIADISLIPTIEGDKKTLQYALDEESLFKLYIDPESPLAISKDFVPVDYKARENDSPCLGGFTGLCVSPKGEVVICVSMPYSVGSLNKNSVKEIWQAAMEKVQSSKLYQWQQLCVADYSECYKEEYCKFCSFCPGMGYLENGFMKKSNVLCLQAKTKMKAYNYLKENG
ncbi:MAG: radical SAM protein [Clostridiales bacterium]|nr:radical SAM protein [Clostridiales bacterium]